jgi:DNA repair protein RecO
MNPTKNVKGIIYRIYNSGQTDRIIYLIDQEGKKVNILAKGVRKPTSRKAHSIDLGNYVEGKVIEGYSLPLLTEIKLLEEFRSWKDSFDKLIFLQFFCEIIDKFTFEENYDDMLFKVFHNCLELNTDRVIYIAAIFLIKILDITGHLPTLNECVITNTDLDPNEVYILDEYVGYISKDALANSGIGGEKITDRIIKTQKFIVDHNVHDALKIQLTREEEAKMFRIELNWLEHTISEKIKSKPIILSLI